MFGGGAGAGREGASGVLVCFGALAEGAVLGGFGVGFQVDEGGGVVVDCAGFQVVECCEAPVSDLAAAVEVDVLVDGAGLDEGLEGGVVDGDAGEFVGEDGVDGLVDLGEAGGCGLGGGGELCGVPGRGRGAGE